VQDYPWWVIIDKLAAEVERAVREEREACAKIADDTHGGTACGEYDSCPQEIAAAIRAQQGEPR
jgi:hypothetical protein